MMRDNFSLSALYYLVILLLVGMQVVAQFNKPQIYLRYTPGFSYRLITGSESWISGLNDLESGLLVQGGDISLDIPLSRRWGLVSGLGFQIYGYQIKGHSDELYAFDVIESFSYAFSYRYHYLNLPVAARFNLISNRRSVLDFRFGVSFSGYLYGQQVTELEYDEGGRTRDVHPMDYDLRKIGLGGILAAMYSQKIGQKLAMQIGPQFDAMLLSQEKGGTVSKFPYRATFVIGVGF